MKPEPCTLAAVGEMISMNGTASLCLGRSKCGAVFWARAVALGNKASSSIHLRTTVELGCFTVRTFQSFVEHLALRPGEWSYRSMGADRLGRKARLADVVSSMRVQLRTGKKQVKQTYVYA
jgi:hypothetical protein